MFDLAVVGHFAIDSMLSPKIAVPKYTLGGPPTYVSLAARKLDAKVSVISKVGKDFSENYIELLNANGIDLSGLKRVDNALTTRFVLRYEDEERKLQLQSRAPPITLEDISRSLKAKVIHIAPISDELSTEIVDRLRTLTEMLSLDPQGFLRRFDEDGNVLLKKWKDPHVLEQIDLYKSSLNEIRMITGLTDLKLAMEKIQDYGVKAVIVTKGVRGSTLLYEENFYEIPACKPRVVRDLTGAGDAFIGAFLAEYVKRKDPVWCMCVGSAAASFVVEGVGPTVFGEKKDIYQRASQIYEKRTFK
jgi:sugar/nucleoside kinase (ribokinase family)